MTGKIAGLHVPLDVAVVGLWVVAGDVIVGPVHPLGITGAGRTARRELFAPQTHAANSISAGRILSRGFTDAASTCIERDPPHTPVERVRCGRISERAEGPTI